MMRQRRGWRNSSLVREHDRHSLRQLWVWAVVCTIALSPMAFYLLEQMQYAHLNAAIEELRADENQFAEQERLLLIERSTLEALPTVEKRSAQLGLIYPDASHRIQVLEEPSGEGWVAER